MVLLHSVLVSVYGAVAKEDIHNSPDDVSTVSCDSDWQRVIIGLHTPHIQANVVDPHISTGVHPLYTSI